MRKFTHPEQQLVWTVEVNGSTVEVQAHHPVTGTDVEQQQFRLRRSARRAEQSFVQDKLAQGFVETDAPLEALLALLAPAPAPAPTPAAPASPVPAPALPAPALVPPAPSAPSTPAPAPTPVPATPVRAHCPPQLPRPDTDPAPSAEHLDRSNTTVQTVLTSPVPPFAADYGPRSIEPVAPRRDRPSASLPIDTHGCAGTMAALLTKHGNLLESMIRHTTVSDEDRTLLQLPVGTMNSPALEAGRSLLLGTFEAAPDAALGCEIADMWVDRAGLCFAVRAVEELHWWLPNNAAIAARDYRLERLTTPLEVGRAGVQMMRPAMFRVRHHLAQATPHEHAAAVAVAEELRGVGLSSACRMSLLFPEQYDWVQQDIAAANELDKAEIAAAQGPHQRRSYAARGLRSLLFYAASTHEHLDQQLRSRHYLGNNLTGPLASMIDAVGDDIAPWLAAWGRAVSTPELPASKGLQPSEESPYIGALATIRTDQATTELCRLHAQRFVARHVQQVATDRPADLVRAASILLAEAPSPGLERLVAHAARIHPVAAAEAVALLDPPSDLIQTIIDQANAPTAGADQCPALLVTPPWENRAESTPLVDALPKRMPKLPKYLNLGGMIPPLLADGVYRLSPEATANLVLILAMSGSHDPYPGLADAVEGLDDVSLARFVWDLFLIWQSADHPAKDTWMLYALGFLGDDTTVDRLVPVILKWPSNGGVQRATKALSVLANIGTPRALMDLYRIGNKAKSKPLRRAAINQVERVAEQLQLTGEELADRLIPDLGLDATGSMTLDYGHRSFTVMFNEQLVPLVRDDDERLRKALPKPGVKDDDELAPAAYKQFAGLKKAAKSLAKDQLARFERLMVAQRQIPATDFSELFVAHPFVVHLVRRLVFAAQLGDEPVGTFRVAEDSTFADANDDPFLLAENATVSVVHPIDMSPAETARWGEVLSDYELLQPFDQIGRSLHEMTAEELGADRFTRFAGQSIQGRDFLKLQQRGWQRGDSEEGGVIRSMLKPLPDGRMLYLELENGLYSWDLAGSPTGGMVAAWIGDGTSKWSRPSVEHTFQTASPVVVSELIRDLELVFAS